MTNHSTQTDSFTVPEIACWIAEIEREYPTLPQREQRKARRQLQELRHELEQRVEEGRIAAETTSFAEVEAYVATLADIPRFTL
jgi:hypothetical protein